MSMWRNKSDANKRMQSDFFAGCAIKKAADARRYSDP